MPIPMEVLLQLLSGTVFIVAARKDLPRPALRWALGRGVNTHWGAAETVVAQQRFLQGPLPPLTLLDLQCTDACLASGSDTE